MFYMLYYDENHYLLLLIYSNPSLSLLLASMLIIMQASRDKKTLDVGANLFIGNLDPDVDEKLLYDTFGAFGVIISTPKVYPSLSLFLFSLTSYPHSCIFLQVIPILFTGRSSKARIETRQTNANQSLLALNVSPPSLTHNLL